MIVCKSIPCTCIKAFIEFPLTYVSVWSSTPQVEDSSFCMDMSSSLSMKCDFSSNSISPYVSSGNTSSSVGIGRPLNPTPQKAETKTSSNHAIAETKLQTIDEMKTACVSDDRGISNFFMTSLQYRLVRVLKNRRIQYLQHTSSRIYSHVWAR